MLVELLTGELHNIQNLLQHHPNKKFLTELENKNYIHRKSKTIYVGEYLVAMFGLLILLGISKITPSMYKMVMYLIDNPILKVEDN